MLANVPVCISRLRSLNYGSSYEADSVLDEQKEMQDSNHLSIVAIACNRRGTDDVISV